MQPRNAREALEANAVQCAAKLGLQVNGAAAGAQAIADAFNAFQAAFNQYQDHVRTIAEENQALKREAAAFRESASKAATAAEPKPTQIPGRAPKP